MNAVRTTPVSRLVFSILTIVAGAILLVDSILYFTPIQPWWGYDVGMFVLAVSFLVAAVTLRVPTLEKAAFWIAAVGYFVLVIGSVNGALHVLVIPGAIIALLGSLGVGILVFRNRTFSRRGNLIYLIAMILSALYCLLFFVPVPGLTDLFVTIAFGIVAVLAGLFI